MVDDNSGNGESSWKAIMIGRVRDEYGLCLNGSSRVGQGGEISEYFLQVREVGLSDRLDVEEVKEREIKDDSYNSDLSNWVGVM